MPGTLSILSMVPPVWPRPRPLILAIFTAAGRHDGRDDQRGLVAHAAGGVLVHLDARNGRKIYHHAAVRHHIGQLGGLFIGHAAQIHRHHPCSHLVIGHFPADKAVDNSFQLFPGVGAAIPFFAIRS